MLGDLAHPSSSSHFFLGFALPGTQEEGTEGGRGGGRSIEVARSVLSGSLGIAERCGSVRLLWLWKAHNRLLKTMPLGFC